MGVPYSRKFPCKAARSSAATGPSNSSPQSAQRIRSPPRLGGADPCLPQPERPSSGEPSGGQVELTRKAPRGAVETCLKGGRCSGEVKAT